LKVTLSTTKQTNNQPVNTLYGQCRIIIYSNPSDAHFLLTDWVLPVAIAGGLILMVAIITIICCVRMTPRSPDKPSNVNKR
jgi:hypothetical protein